MILHCISDIVMYTLRQRRTVGKGGSSISVLSKYCRKSSSKFPGRRPTENIAKFKREQNKDLKRRRDNHTKDVLKIMRYEEKYVGVCHTWSKYITRNARCALGKEIRCIIFPYVVNNMYNVLVGTPDWQMPRFGF